MRPAHPARAARPPAALRSHESARAGGGARARLGMRETLALIVGLAIGAGIFKAPSVVAANVPSAEWMFGLWIVGGIFSILGALCYAELASAYPSAGGEYHFLSRAFGRDTALVYAWARVSVLTTGSIALLGFVFGDYAQRLVPLGPHGPALYAALAVVLLTAIHLRGLRGSARTQSWLTVMEVAGLALIVVAALWLWLGGDRPGAASDAAAVALAGSAGAPLSMQGVGLALVFVLLTFGGWSDAAYVTAELRDRRAMARALWMSVCFITGLYLLVNWACWWVLGLAGMAQSDTVATDVLELAFGPVAGQFIAALVALAALASMNATLLVGARGTGALGHDWPRLAWLARRDMRTGAPRNSFLTQGVLALALVALGAGFHDGFQAMVEFTAPVFWLFFFLTGLSLFRLRRIDPARPRPFRVPFYPLVPALFCLSSLYMLWASLSFVYAQEFGGFNAAWVGVGVLASGVALRCWLGRAEIQAVQADL